MAATWEAVFNQPHLGSLKSVQALTEAAPTLATEGLNLEAGEAFDVWIEAAVGQTLTGTGVLRGYRYEPSIGWALMPSADIGIPDTAAGQRRAVLGSYVVQNRRGRFALIADGITVSGGGITLYFIATRPGGGLL